MSTLPRACRFLLVFAALAAYGRTTQAEQIVNGGFENPAAPPLADGGFVTITPGFEPPNFGWQVFQGSVDLGRGANAFVQFGPEEGQQGLDMAGTNNGGITQAFPTVPGQTYRLSFIYADNPQNFQELKSMDLALFVDGQVIPFFEDSVSHNTSTNGPPAASNALLYETVFIAVSPMTRLSFLNTTPSNSPSSGILLDAVSVTAVPEPASVAIALCGAVALLGSRLIRRRAD